MALTLAHEAAFSGVIRSVYFLAVAAVGVFVVVTGVVAVYEPPSQTSSSFSIPANNIGTSGSSGFVQSTSSSSGDDREGYNRNVALIMSGVSAGIIAIAILGFGSNANHLRAGLLLGGLGLFLISMGFWANSSDRWIGFITSLIVFAVLTGSYRLVSAGLIRVGVRASVPPPAPPPAPEP